MKPLCDHTLVEVKLSAVECFVCVCVLREVVVFLINQFFYVFIMKEHKNKLAFRKFIVTVYLKNIISTLSLLFAIILNFSS